MSRRLLFGLALAGALAGCGGGGGGSGGSGGITSLVPTPLAPGAVLVANAADLRPLRDGAQWQYHGTGRPNGGAIATYYTATVQQRASAGGGFAESSDSVLLAGSDTSTVLLAGGAVSVQATDPLGTGSAEVVTFTELRSPVRINDQYTQLERNDVPLGADIDGDGKPDVADVAFYATVIGTENVVLRELARTISAVRVDVTALVRAKKSSDGTALPVVRVVQTNWYATGIGIVRRSQTAPATTGIGPVENDETLFSWDGVTEGLGSIGPTPIHVPASSSLLPRALASAVVGNSALVAMDTLDFTDPTSLTLGVFDKRGNLQSMRQYAGLSVAPGNTFPRLHGIDASTALLAMPVAGAAFGTTDLRLQRFDSAGNLLGSAATLNIGASTDIVTAWDGQVLWAGWRADDSVTGAQLLIRPFSADGLPLAVAQTVDSESAGQIGAMRMAAAAGRLLVTWTRFDLGTANYQYAIVQGSGGTADVRTLGSNPSAGSFSLGNSSLVPLLGSGVAALQWSGPIFSFAGGGPMPDSQLRGVTLDAAWSPRRSTAGSLDGELLPSGWTGINVPVLAGALNDRLVVASFIRQLQIPELFSPSDFVLTSFLQPGVNPLASAAAGAPTLTNISGTLTNINEFGQPQQLLLWDDRALVIGDDSNRTTVSLFWLR
jgi:hypothetical protein